MAIKEAVHLYEEAFQKIIEANEILGLNGIELCGVYLKDVLEVHVYENIEKIIKELNLDVGFLNLDDETYPVKAIAEKGDIRFFELGRLENGIFKG